VQVTTHDATTQQHLSLCKPLSAMRNPDGSEVSLARRRWHKAISIVRSRLAIAGVFRVIQGRGGGAAAGDGAAADSVAASRAVFGGAGMWFRQVRAHACARRRPPCRGRQSPEAFVCRSRSSARTRWACGR
jgi:hypothetical protein